MEDHKKETKVAKFKNLGVNGSISPKVRDVIWVQAGSTRIVTLKKFVLVVNSCGKVTFCCWHKGRFPFGCTIDAVGLLIGLGFRHQNIRKQ